MEILCAERPCPNLGFSLNALGFGELGFGAEAFVELERGCCERARESERYGVSW